MDAEEKSIDDGRSEADSNISGGSVGEDLRHLKEFKSLISEKMVPKSIKCLEWTMFLLLLCMFAVAGTNWLKLSEI